MVRLNNTGTVDTAFYANLGSGFNSTVFAISYQSDNKILVGGGFTALNGIARDYFVRLNNDGSVDTSFYTKLGSGFNNYVFPITVQADGKILLGGGFTIFNGLSRNYLL